MKNEPVTDRPLVNKVDLLVVSHKGVQLVPGRIVPHLTPAIEIKLESSDASFRHLLDFKTAGLLYEELGKLIPSSAIKNNR